MHEIVEFTGEVIEDMAKYLYSAHIKSDPISITVCLPITLFQK